MNCKKCGAPLEAGAKVCTSCGELVSNMGISSSQLNEQPQVVQNNPAQTSLQESQLPISGLNNANNQPQVAQTPVTQVNNQPINQAALQSGIPTPEIVPTPNINGPSIAPIDQAQPLEQQANLQNSEQPKDKKKKKEKKNKTEENNNSSNNNVLVIVLVAIIALAIGGTIGYIAGSKTNNASNSSTNLVNENNNTDDNNSNAVSDNNFLGYSFELPDGFNFISDDESLIVSDNEVTFSIELFKDNFDNYYNTPSVFRSLFENNYVINGSIRTITNNDLRLVAIPVESGSLNMYAVISETSIDGVVALSFLKRVDNQLDIQNMDYLTYVLNSLEQVDNTVSLTSGVKVN